METQEKTVMKRSHRRADGLKRKKNGSYVWDQPSQCKPSEEVPYQDVSGGKNT